MTSMHYTPATERSKDGGSQRKFHFDNGYRASVVCSPYSYGGASGLFELAVMDHSDVIVYDTPVTNDVLGWLTEDDVQKALAEIEALPARVA